MNICMYVRTYTTFNAANDFIVCVYVCVCVYARARGMRKYSGCVKTLSSTCLACSGLLCKRICIHGKCPNRDIR